MMKRRGLAAAALAGGILPANAQQAGVPMRMEDLVHGRERIAFLIYPGFTALDMFGPQQMLAGLMPARMDLVAATRDPVRSDLGVGIMPTATFDEIEPGLDILCVPGGAQGTLAAMADPATIAFVARQGALPAIRISPDVGVRRPLASLMSVVLPLPLGPSRPTMRPGSIVRSMLSSTVLAP